MQNMSFSRSKKYQNVIFLDANIFQNLTCRKIFNSKSNALYFFQFKIWRVVKTSKQNRRVVKILYHNLTSFKTFSTNSDIYIVFQFLTDWWYLLPTLLPTYFKEEKKKTMRVMELVARWTTGSRHTSIRLSMCEEYHYDNTKISQKLRTEHCGA